MRLSGIFTATIRRQIIISFAIVGMLLLVFTAVSFYQLDRVRQLAEDVRPNTVQIESQQRFVRSLSNLESDLEQYFLTGSQQYKETAQSELVTMNQAKTVIRAYEFETSEPALDTFEQVFADLETDMVNLMAVDFFALTPGEQNQYIVSIFNQIETVDEAHQALTDATIEELTDASQKQQDILASLVIQFAVLSAITVVVALVAAQLTSVRIAGPVSHTVHIASQMASGELDVRVEIGRRRDEIGQLANAFNQMADQLSDLIGSLEARVQARTRDLRLAAQVSGQVATILDPEQLLPQVVELTKDSFDLYHAHVYLYDTASNYLVLAAGAGEAGRIMKEGGHRILGSARSLVAQAARQNRAVIVDDVRNDPDFLPNPLLSGTLSEAAVPLAVGDRVIGVLDVQSEQVARFDRDLISVLLTLSGQIAVSLDNARLFSEMERTTRQERVLGVITQEMQRATSIDDVLQVAARELGKALRVSETAIELHLPDDGHRETEPE